jgi:hypothetical protein
MCQKLWIKNTAVGLQTVLNYEYGCLLGCCIRVIRPEDGDSKHP